MNRIISILLLAVQAHALKKVLVTGAGGRTGKLVFEQLKADDNYKPVGLARSSKAQKALSAVGASDDEVVVADIADEKSLADAMSGLRRRRAVHERSASHQAAVADEDDGHQGPAICENK